MHRDNGLFFAPLPLGVPGREKILVLARFLGTYLAKAMLDNRLVLPRTLNA